jgi:hypothetical protein
MSNYVLILKDCVKRIFPKLRTELNFHRQLAKGGVNTQGMPFVNKRTGKPYMATTQLNHVLVGLSGLVRLLNYLSQQNLLTKEVKNSDFKRVCALFCLHDLHKDNEIKREVQNRDTSIKPDLMAEIAHNVGLTEWLGNDDLTGYEYYEAMIHLSDATHGNRKYCRGEINYEKLYSLVRLADSMASVQSLEEGTNGLKNRLKDFSRSLKNLQFFYHKINDYRGLTTNFYHQSIAKILQEEYQLFPLLFFDNGTVYLGENAPEFEKNIFLSLVTQQFNQSLQTLGHKSTDELEYNGKIQRFEKYIFAFSGVDKQLEYLKHNSIKKSQIGWFYGNPDKPNQDFLSKRFKNKKFQDTFKDQDNFLKVFNMSEPKDKDEDFAQKWEAVSRYLGGVLNLLNDIYLAPHNHWEKTINFVGNLLKVSPDVQTNIIDNVSVFNQSGTPEFSHILAYHYLNILKYEDLSPSTIPIDNILEILHYTLLPEIVKLDTIEKRNNYVEDELAFNFDTLDFLDKNLVLSWENHRNIEDDPLKIIASKKKTGSPARLCSLCNRVITNKMKSAPIKADIIEDGIKEFSNRLVPKNSVSSRVWCPQCYLEWMSRKLAGLGYATGADKNNSSRLYFFILPNPILTPEFLDVLRNQLEVLHKKTSINVKQYGKDGVKSIPRIWLESQDFTVEDRGKNWLNQVLNSLTEESERLIKLTQEKEKRMAGEYLMLSDCDFFDDYNLDELDFEDQEEDEEIFNHNRLASNFLIVTLEASSYGGKNAEPITKTELWMRGVLTLLVLQDLLGMRIYLTDKPYLPVAYLDQLHESLELDGEHLALRSLFNPNFNGFSVSNSLSLREIPINDLLDRISALWVINEGLNDKEKGIARCLQEVNRNELAGARFFADYQRKLDENNKGKKDSYISVSPTLFNRACYIILDTFEQEAKGYSMTMKNLAQTIAIQSLNLFLPIKPKDGKGKANRYEKPYRSAISALKQISRQPDVSTEEIIGHITGALIKQLSRLDTGISFPFNWKDEEKNKLAHQFAQTIVVNLFQERCSSSFSRLSRYENDLANGVFFYISENLDSKWQEFKDLNEKRKKDKQNNDESE